MDDRRKHLRDFSRASKDIEMAEVAINILEYVSGCASIVRALKRKQHVFLRRIDRAAEGLGVPPKTIGAE